MFAFITFAVLLVSAHAHKCMHSTPDIQSAYHQATVAPVSRPFHESAMESIRVAIDYKNIEDNAKICVTLGETKPVMNKNVPAETATCKNWHLVTAAIRTALKTYIMPYAKEVIEGVFSVNRISSQVIAPGNCGLNVDVSGALNPTNVDLQIFVTAGALPDDYANTIAYAYPCTLDGSSRTISAVVNFNPSFAGNWTTGKDTYANSELKDTAVHELLHALGFTQSNLAAQKARRDIRGKTVDIVTRTLVVNQTQAYFNCPSATGLEIEDEGSAGSAGAHWDRRIVFEELMTAAGGSKLSNFTLAFMESLGYYSVNYSKAVGMVSGKGSGCGYIDEKCNTVAGGKGSTWHFDTNFRCSVDHRLVGKGSWRRGSQDVTTYFRYDSSDATLGGGIFVDQCPYAQRVTSYECAYEGSPIVSEEAGMFFGSKSRCFETSGVKKASTSIVIDPRCFEARCPFGGSRIEFRVGSKWQSCPLDGAVRSIDVAAPFSGTVSCPAPSALCDASISFGTAGREAKPVTDTEIATTSGSPLVSFTLTLNGTWGFIRTDNAKRIDVYNSLRLDLGYALRVGSAAIRIRRLYLTSGGDISLIIGVTDDGKNALTPQIVSQAFASMITSKSVDLLYTRQAYDKQASGSSFVSLSSYNVDSPSTSSVCASDIPPERCVIILGVVITVVSGLILLIFIYCICLRSPFEIPPQVPRAFRPDKI